MFIWSHSLQFKMSTFMFENWSCQYQYENIKQLIIKAYSSNSNFGTRDRTSRLSISIKRLSHFKWEISKNFVNGIYYFV